MITRSVFHAATALRRESIFHPRGECFSGSVRTDLPSGGRDVRTYKCAARLSKGAGTWGSMPDALGLALRILLPTPWDILMVSSFGPWLPGRLGISPARSWTAAWYSTLMPQKFASDRTLTWILARSADPHAISCRHGAATSAIKKSPLHFHLFSSSTGTSKDQARGEVVLDTPIREGLSFDPGLNHPAGIQLYPEWLTRLRTAAYSGSRTARNATLQA